MISQKGEHTASRNQMPNQSTSIHQIRTTVTSALHPVIIPAGQPHQRQDAPVVQQSPGASRRCPDGISSASVSPVIWLAVVLEPALPGRSWNASDSPVLSHQAVNRVMT
jgi:hypothetical protein